MAGGSRVPQPRGRQCHPYRPLSTHGSSPVPPAQGEAVLSLQGAFCPQRPGSPPLDEAPRFQRGLPFLTEAQGCGNL